MATIGYGTSDYYFGDCWTPFILVLLQVFSAIVFSSLAVGLLFQRISRGQKRGRTIVFSDAAIIRKVGGRCVSRQSCFIDFIKRNKLFLIILLLHTVGILCFVLRN